MYAASRAWMNDVPYEMQRFRKYIEVINDINEWMVKHAPYRHVFRAVCYKISKERDEERQSEMWHRLFQECLESVGMCTDGHLSRLVNVFVGFDDEIKPQIPLGELIQQKLSAISQMDIADADKLRIATEFFDEHAVADEERAPWLEALA